MAEQTSADALARAIAVMTRLRGPEGCPWDAEQTHISLTKYAIEEAYEVAEAAETGDDEALEEELGDLLLQVLFHAEIARERGAFTLDDVANTLVEKLTRRHPHVFADGNAATPEEVEENWDAIKRAEKPRSHPLEGIPHLPALVRAQKVMSRAGKAGLLPPAESLPPGEPPTSTGGEALPPPVAAAPEPASSETIGAELLALVERAQSLGIDAEQSLRHATRDLEAKLDLPSRA